MGRIADMKKQELERKRKNRNIFLVVMVVIGIVIAIVIHPVLGVVIGLVPLVVKAMLEAGDDIVKGEKDMYKMLKEEVAPKEIEMLLPGAEYSPYEGITEEEYLLAEYANPVGEYRASDKITYNVKVDDNLVCNMQFSEVKIIKNSKEKNPFVSVLVVGKLPKDIRSKIKINKAGTYEKDHIFKVVSGMSEFDEVFDIISPNKKLVPKVLTENLIQNWLKIYNIYGRTMDISIVRDTIYIRVESEYIIKDTKEGKAIDRMALERRYKMVKSLSEMVVTAYKEIGSIDL